MIENLINVINMIPQDKIEHFFVCLIACMSTGTFASLFTDVETASFIAAAATTGLALGKEYGDKKAVGNHWCWWDLLADAIGMLLGIAIIVLLYKIIN